MEETQRIWRYECKEHGEFFREYANINERCVECNEIAIMDWKYDGGKKSEKVRKKEAAKDDY